MATSPAFLRNLELLPERNHSSEAQRQPHQQPMDRTDVPPRPIGTALRSVRRRTTPEAGFALEILGHAIEYLADEYVHEAGLLPSIHIRSGDPRVEAIQLLMAANRQVYYACPVVPSLSQRVIQRLFGW
jgi:hypothetical protein